MTATSDDDDGNSSTDQDQDRTTTTKWTSPRRVKSSKRKEQVNEDDERRGGGKKSKKNMAAIMDSDQPLKRLETRTAIAVKRVVDLKIFGYAKFLLTDKDVESGYIHLVFAELNWTRDTPVDHIRRARSWKAIVDYVIKRVAERRAAAIAAIKKACVGKWNQHVTQQLTKSFLTHSFLKNTKRRGKKMLRKEKKS